MCRCHCGSSELKITTPSVYKMKTRRKGHLKKYIFKMNNSIGLWLISLHLFLCNILFLCFRHFLFKQGSGSSALLSGAGQGYPLTSGTVYSPPPRPLPRSSVTRPLFTFNKPHRCCNWKCTALSASLLTLTLALLLTYVIGEFLCFMTFPCNRTVFFSFYLYQGNSVRRQHLNNLFLFWALSRFRFIEFL